MVILSIETNTQVCSAALIADGACISSYINLEHSNHATILPVYIQDLMKEAEKRRLRIEGVALSEGPGSYTGMRIGASTAKGLCFGLGIPLIAIPTTEVLCESLKAVHNEPNALLMPMIDARRMEVYTALYNNEVEVISPISAQIIDETFKKELANITSKQPNDAYKSILYFGDGAAKCTVALESENTHYIADIVPDAKYMGAIAERYITEKKNIIEGKALAYYEPFYLKEFIAAPSHVKGLYKETH